MDIILLLLSSSGLVQIIQYSKLRVFNLLRRVFPSILCSMCLGFWVGLGLAAVHLGLSDIFQVFLLGLASSQVSYFLDVGVSDGGIRIDRGKGAEKVEIATGETVL